MYLFQNKTLLKWDLKSSNPWVHANGISLYLKNHLNSLVKTNQTVRQVAKWCKEILQEIYIQEEKSSTH